MAETSAEQTPYEKPPEHHDNDKCPDPFEPYTRYRVAAEIAKKQESLFTADATAVATKYGRLAGAQQRYADAWAAQKKNWADLACQLDRIRETLHRALDDAMRKHLEDCWRKLRNETTEATQRADCKDIFELDCERLLENVIKLEPDELANALERWRRQAALAATCVAQEDQDFDDLANFPEQLPQLISELTDRASQIDDDLANPGNDPQRSYVKYLALHHDFCELWRKLITAAAYTCKLKYVFVRLLRIHESSICLQVAIHGAEQRTSIEDEAKQARATNIVDLVLECALPAQDGDTTPPPGDCAPEPGPKQQVGPTSTQAEAEAVAEA
jgi:hypothetical protein